VLTNKQQHYIHHIRPGRTVCDNASGTGVPVYTIRTGAQNDRMEQIEKQQNKFSFA